MPECCQHLRQPLVCERACKWVFLCLHAVSLLPCALFVFVNESQMLCVCERAASCVSMWSFFLGKKKKKGKLKHCLKSWNWSHLTQVLWLYLETDPLCFQDSTLHALCPALTKELWVCLSNFLNTHTKSASVGRCFDLESYFTMTVHDRFVSMRGRKNSFSLNSVLAPLWINSTHKLTNTVNS